MAKRVLVQAGHVSPREPGFPAVGTFREQEFNLIMRRKLVRLLQRDGRFDPIAVPGDIPDGIKVDAALFLHGDGSSNPAASGFSFGYPDYAVNKKLADLIAVEFEKIPGHPPHHADNYTADLRGYYGFRRVDTPGPEVLVEHGFLTNPAEREWMFANADRLAQAEYRALLRFFGFARRRWRFELWVTIDGKAYRIGRSRPATRARLAARAAAFTAAMAPRMATAAVRRQRPRIRRVSV